MEIEAKFRISAEHLERVAALRSLGRYSLVPSPAPEQQDNRYYDTTDGRLAAARYGLRVRRVGTRALITLKGPSSVNGDGVHRRAEHEFPGDNPEPNSWPPGPARDLALALTGGARLGPTVGVDTERRILHVFFAGHAVAELCLDRGVLRGGGREQPFTELEIELLAAGDAGDLAAVTAELQRLVKLVPEPRSKLQRAADLAAHEG